MEIFGGDDDDHAYSTLITPLPGKTRVPRNSFDYDYDYDYDYGYDYGYDCCKRKPQQYESGM